MSYSSSVPSLGVSTVQPFRQILVCGGSNQYICLSFWQLVGDDGTPVIAEFLQSAVYTWVHQYMVFQLTMYHIYNVLNVDCYPWPFSEIQFNDYNVFL